MENVRIAILNSNNTRIGHLDNSAPDALHYYDDVLHEYLEGASSTLSFTVDAHHADSSLLEEGNKLSFVRNNKSYYFSIMKVTKDEKEIDILAYSSCFEFINETLLPYSAPSAMTFVQYVNAFMVEFRIVEILINEVADKTIKHEWTGSDTILARLYSLANVFDAEIEFVPVLNDDGTLNIIQLNVYKQHSETDQGIGQATGETLRYGNEVTSITKETDLTELYTCIRAYGKDNLTISTLDIDVKDADGNTLYYSPVGNATLYAPQSRDRFPSNVDSESDRYIRYMATTDYSSVNALYGYMLSTLKKLCQPKVSYDVKGYHECGIGDTVTIIDEAFNPPLYLSARAVEQEISFTDTGRNKTKFDNFTEMAPEIEIESLAVDEVARAAAAAAQSTANTALSDAAAAQSTAEGAASTASSAQSTAESAASTASSAASAASAAQTAAGNAASAASAAQSDATQALSDASAAQSDATQALSDASAAQADATQALSDAASAASAASSAASAASSAQSTANSAQADATQALSDAASAASAASSASSAASFAQTTANSAQADATQALSDASAAQADATQALSDAASAASAASSAASAASSAQTTANSAQADATQALSDAADAQTDATQALSDAAAAQGDATQALADAAAAQADINAQKNYFWHDSSGAHVATVAGDATTGDNVLLDSSGLKVRDGTNVLAAFAASLIELGKNSNSAVIKMCDGHLEFSVDTSGANKAYILAPLTNLGISSPSGDISMDAPGLSLQATAQAGEINLISPNILVQGDSFAFNNHEVMWDNHFYHNFTVPTSSQAANAWRNATSNSVNIPAAKWANTGLYLVNYNVRLQGSGSGIAGARWYNEAAAGEIGSINSYVSRASCPLHGTLQTSINATFIVNSSNTALPYFKGYPQIYANVSFTVQSASVSATRIGSSWSSS